MSAGNFFLTHGHRRSFGSKSQLLTRPDSFTGNYFVIIVMFFMTVGLVEMAVIENDANTCCRKQTTDANSIGCLKSLCVFCVLSHGRIAVNREYGSAPDKS